MGIFENFDALRVRTSLSSWIISNSRFAVYDMPSWSHFWATRTILIFTLKRKSFRLFQRNLNHPIFKNISGNITNCQYFKKCCRRAKFNEKPIKSFRSLKKNICCLINGKWVTDKCQSEHCFKFILPTMIHPTVMMMPKNCIILDASSSEKKQISLISNAKSDFSVNKNLKREEEALDTDAEIQHNIL